MEIGKKSISIVESNIEGKWKVGFHDGSCVAYFESGDEGFLSIIMEYLHKMRDGHDLTKYKAF